MRAVPLLVWLSFATSLAAQFPPSLFSGAPAIQTGFTEEIELLADVDGDGDVDGIGFQAVPNSGYKSSFRALRNDGTGNLIPGTAIAIPYPAGTFVTVADVNGDSTPDVLVSTAPPNTFGNGFLLYTGQPGATYAAPVHVPLPRAPRELWPGNANGDAFADVLVVSSDSSPAVYADWLLGGASLAFAGGPSLTLPATYYAISSVVGDFDNDGVTDLAMLTQSASPPFATSVGLFRTAASGLVPLASPALPFSSPDGITKGDLESDGDLDLIAWSDNGAGSASMIVVPIVNSGGAFVAGASQIVISTSFRQLHAADLDGDGDADLVGREANSIPNASVSLTWIGNDQGQFSFVRGGSAAIGSVGAGVGFADLDANGQPDYVDARFVCHNTTLEGAGMGPSVFGGLDWDGDGDLDVLQGLELRKNDGRGLMTTMAGFAPPSPGVNRFYGGSVATADFDGDGLQELLVPLVQQLGAQQTFLEMRLLEANGDDALHDGGIAAASTVRIETGGIVDDADGDGDLDFVNAQGVWQYAAGSFTLVPHAFQFHNPVAKGDVDGDGDLDLIAVRSGTPSLALLLRTGPASYTFTSLVAATSFFVEPTSALLVDLDDDGDLDAVAKERPLSGPAQTRIFTNAGGIFTSALVLPYAGILLAGDIDNDGKTDLGVQETGQLRLLRRIGPGLTYAPAASLAMSAANAFFDFDQDGDLDILGQPTVWNHLHAAPTGGHHRQYGLGSPGTDGRRPLLSMVGPIREGSSTTARLLAGPGGALALLLAGTFEVDVPNVLPGITAYIGDLPFQFVVSLGGAPGQPGAGSLDLPLFMPPGTNGDRFFLEALVLDPAGPVGLTNSNGCEMLVGN